MNAGTKRAADCLIQLIMEAYRADYANEQYRDVKGNIPDMFRELSKKNPACGQTQNGKITIMVHHRYGITKRRKSQVPLRAGGKMTHPYITRMERFGTLNPAELSGRRYLGICDNCGSIMMPDEADPLYCGGNVVFCCEECRDEFCEGELNHE